MPDHATYQWLITTLVGVIGLFAGIGIAHLAVLRKINQMIVVQARVSEQIKTLFGRQDDLQASNASCMAMHRETVQLVGDLVRQNSVLMGRK